MSTTADTKRMLLIPADVSAGTSVMESPAKLWLENLQSQVGGLIEPVDLPDLELTLWVNEEGRLLGLGRNVRADLVVMGGGGVTFGPLLGDAVVTGPTNSKGETLGISNGKVNQIGGWLA